MGRRNGRTRRRTSSTVFTDKRTFELSAVAATSSSGITVATSYLLSTALCAGWTNLATQYLKWKIKYIVFAFRSQIATSNNGRIALCVSQDADGNYPTTFVGAKSLKPSIETAGFKNATIRFKPMHNAAKWYYTGDLSLNEDRLEYQGNLTFLSGSFVSAGVPGYIDCYAVSEWCDPCNSETSLSRTLKSVPLIESFVQRYSTAKMLELAPREKREISDDPNVAEALDFADSSVKLTEAGQPYDVPDTPSPDKDPDVDKDKQKRINASFVEIFDKIGLRDLARGRPAAEQTLLDKYVQQRIDQYLAQLRATEQL